MISACVFRKSTNYTAMCQTNIRKQTNTNTKIKSGPCRVVNELVGVSHTYCAYLWEWAWHIRVTRLWGSRNRYVLSVRDDMKCVKAITYDVLDLWITQQIHNIIVKYPKILRHLRVWHISLNRLSLRFYISLLILALYNKIRHLRYVIAKSEYCMCNDKQVMLNDWERMIGPFCNCYL